MPNLLRLKDFVKQNSSIVKMPTIRSWIRKDPNLPFLVRIGRLVFVDEEKFFEWIRNRNLK